MRLVLVLAALGALLAGCAAKTTPAPSVLQKFQLTRAELADATSASSRLAADSFTLTVALSSQNTVRVRASAVTLKADALDLEDSAGRSAAAVRTLLRQTANVHVRAYFRDLLAGLIDQWAEADRLIHVAQTVWWEPWLATRADVRRERAYDGQARWDAWQAVQNTMAVQRIRRRYPRAFRYIPVSTPRGPAQVAAGSEENSR